MKIVKKALFYQNVLKCRWWKLAILIQHINIESDDHVTQYIVAITCIVLSNHLLQLLTPVPKPWSICLANDTPSLCPLYPSVSSWSRWWLKLNGIFSSMHKTNIALSIMSSVSRFVGSKNHSLQYFLIFHPQLPIVWKSYLLEVYSWL